MNNSIEHIANEWADMAINGIQWLRNIRDGISTPVEALIEMEANYARICNLRDGIPTEESDASIHALIHVFLSGVPTELTEASPAVTYVRDVLNGPCVFPRNGGSEVDVGGCVYWNENKTVAVYVP